MQTAKTLSFPASKPKLVSAGNPNISIRMPRYHETGPASHGHAKTIGIILSDNEYSAMQFTGIMREAMKFGFDVKLYPDSEPEKTFSQIIENQIKNVIVLSACDTLREKAAVLARKYGIHLVYISEYSHGEFPAINIDNFAAAEMATDYLIRCGHRRIALSCAQHDLHSEEDFGRKYILERHNGFIHALKQAGIPDERSSPKTIADI